MDSCSLFSCFPAELILTMRLGRGEEHSRGKCPPPDSDPFNAVEYGRIYANLSRNLSAEADCGFKFQKRGQLFIRSHNGNAFRRRGVHQQSDCSSFFIHRCVHRQLRSLLNLRNYSQGKVVTVAALVTHLVSVAVTGEDRAVRKITECACNRCRRRIVDYRENCTRCEGATSKISKGKLRATVNGHPVGDHLIGGGVAAVHVHIVGSVDAKGQRTLDGKGAGAAQAMYIPGG